MLKNRNKRKKDSEPLILRKVSANNYEAFSSYGYGGIITDRFNNNFLDIDALSNF